MAPRTRLAARLESAEQSSEQPATTAVQSNRKPAARKAKTRKPSDKVKLLQDPDTRPRKRRRTEPGPRSLTFIEEHQPDLPPILRLPLDVFHEILHLLTEKLVSGRTPDQAPPILVASQVCRLWRRYAFASPRLWRNFQFTIPRPKKHSSRLAPPPKSIPMSAWVKSAKVFPTSASLCVSPGQKALSLHPSIIKTILPGVKKLRSLSMSLPLSTYTGLECAATDSFRSLEQLHIHVSSIKDLDAYRAGWNYPIPAFQQSPLKQVKLTSFADCGLLNQRGLALLLPWSRLTDLTIKEGRVDGDACVGVLLQSKSLQRCIMQGVIAWEYDTTLPSAVISLPELQSMDVSFVGAGSAWPLFASVEFPNLRELIMTNIPAHFFEAAVFGDRCCRVLEKFVMHESGLDLRLETLIRRMPMLKYFEIDTNDLYLGVDVYPLLIKSASVTPHLLPLLETFVVTESYMWEPHYDNYEEEEWKDDSLAEMVASRFRPRPPTETLAVTFAKLKNVTINYKHRLVYEDAKLLLEACKREGLKLEINDCPRETY